jgi:hypothetical protein
MAKASKIDQRAADGRQFQEERQEAFACNGTQESAALVSRRTGAAAGR